MIQHYMPTTMRNDGFLQSVVLLRAGHTPCQRREGTISSNNGVVNARAHEVLMQLFTLADK